MSNSKLNSKFKPRFIMLFSLMLLVIIFSSILVSSANESTIIGSPIVEKNIVEPTIAGGVTRAEAVLAIANAKNDIAEMQSYGLTVNAVTDLLREANLALERADFSETLKTNVSGEIAQQAKKALVSVNYQGFTYSEVLKYTIEITIKKETALRLLDTFSVLKAKMNEYVINGVNISSSEVIFLQAQDAFVKERYIETEQLLTQSEQELENKRAELTALRVVVQSSKNFITNNWKELLIVLAVLIILTILCFRKIRRVLLKRKLNSLKIEEKSLMEMMKKSQRDRFETGAISNLVYNVRKDKYLAKINEIKHTIPVVEAELRGKSKVKLNKSKKSKRQNNKIKSK